MGKIGYFKAILEQNGICIWFQVSGVSKQMTEDRRQIGYLISPFYHLSSVIWSLSSES